MDSLELKNNEIENLELRNTLFKNWMNSIAKMEMTEKRVSELENR